MRYSESTNKVKEYIQRKNKGQVKIQEIQKETGIKSERTIWNILQELVSEKILHKVRVGLKKFYYFINKYDKWILQRIQRICRETMRKIKMYSGFISKSKNKSKSKYLYEDFIC